MITIGWTPTAEELAAVRLVAAAPDLLAALEFIETALGSRVEAQTAEALQRKARAAIAKAKGAP